MPEGLVLHEAGPPVTLAMTREMASELGRLRIAEVIPSPHPDRWIVSGVRKVGVVRLEGEQVFIEPKIPLRSLVALMGYAAEQVTWWDQPILIDDGDVLTDALATAYANTLERATARGLVRAYRSVSESSQIVRGRWDVARQVRVGLGALVPAEIDFDEFDLDTVPNRVLLAAATALIRLPGIREPVARRLRSLIKRFDGVTLIRYGPQVPPVVTDRTNRHLEPALRLASLVLQRRGVEHHHGQTVGGSFLVTMSTIFERFVEIELARAGRREGLEVIAQSETALDMDGLVKIKPDVTVRRGSDVLAVVDAKYKEEKPAGFPNADIYQALTYAVRNRLGEATLIYARGLGPQIDYRIASAGVTIRCIALDLTAPHDEMVAPLHDLVRRVAERSMTASAAG